MNFPENSPLVPATAHPLSPSRRLFVGGLTTGMFAVVMGQSTAQEVGKELAPAVKAPPQALKRNPLGQISGGQPQEKIPRFGLKTDLKRAGQPIELAPAFVLLASQESNFVTGFVYSVTGDMGEP